MTTHVNQFCNISLHFPQQPIIKTVRQTIFNFNSNSKDKINHSKLLSLQKQSFNDYIIANNSIISKPIPIKESYIWKPKIPSKKLFQQPKFLLSLERKKIKVQNSIRNQKMPLTQKANKSFKSDKIKTFSKSFYKQPQSYEYISQYVSEQIIPFTQRNIERKTKTPHLNFNMHYLINKRKKFIMQEALIKGSNIPYYNIFSNQKLQADEIIKSNHGGNASQRINRLRISKTASYRKKLKPSQ